MSKTAKIRDDIPEYRLYQSIDFNQKENELEISVHGGLRKTNPEPLIWHEDNDNEIELYKKIGKSAYQKEKNESTYQEILYKIDKQIKILKLHKENSIVTQQQINQIIKQQLRGLRKLHILTVFNLCMQRNLGLRES